MARVVNSADPFRDAQVVLCVGGGIAAYKAVEVVRLLTRAGARVRVAMTDAAQKFVGPLTFQTLSGEAVFTDLLDLAQDSEIDHIRVADSADLVVVAPATANLMSRLAAGAASDAVSAVILATRAPVLLAPAMNVNMWSHPLTRSNVERLTEVAGYHLVGPESGELACRWVGPGRMAEPVDIVAAAAILLSPQDLAGRRVLVTAGPTQEPVDPVRFLANRSSGKMGYAVARVARRRGAEVTLVSGPVAEQPPFGVRVVSVTTALEMERAVAAESENADAVIMAAAVADARPAQVPEQKLKRGNGVLASLELAENPDILRGLGSARGAAGAPILVGFAAETEKLVDHARDKLAAKGCDAVFANDVSAADAGFGSEKNRGVLVTATEERVWELADKHVIAGHILDWLGERWAGQDTG